MRKTISIGVCEFPADTQNFWEAIKFADVAFYKAKERGRNKVLRFEIDMWAGQRY
ncbi:MAG: diguanylate cyclase [Alphaproteobacteria bacterium]|uniref:Diguanylate cyclase n=1 Tax=Candidatus Nitrobium versatile TaxID=2884831 RepID=A0A953LW55_9BACT|nr:diguanylate cyclase [Candidatus Nitrobium versatile]